MCVCFIFFSVGGSYLGVGTAVEFRELLTVQEEFEDVGAPGEEGRHGEGLHELLRVGVSVLLKFCFVIFWLEISKRASEQVSK